MTNNIDFTALTANPLFYRTYSRYKADGTKESAKEAKDRAINGLKKFKLLTEEEVELITKYFYENKVFVSGRWFWVGGTEWVERQKNFIGAYNCASVPVTNWDAFRFNFRALLMGCGVGTVVEQDKISQLPEIKYPINLVEVTELGTNWEEGNAENDDSCFTAYKIDDDTLGVVYTVGDSKEGWVDVATDLLEFSSYDQEIPNLEYKQVNLSIDLSYVRPGGIPLKGFGGTSNPDLLENGLRTIIEILNESVGRKLNSLEVCKILGVHGVVTVAGSIRRSARINQGTPTDIEFIESKDNLWIQDAQGKWKIDPKRDMLRYANHSNVYHDKPDLNTIIEAVRKQYYSGEGAIQYAPEAIARSSVDLLNTQKRKRKFLDKYSTSKSKAKDYLQRLSGNTLDDRELNHRMERLGLNPCHSGDTLVSTNKGLIPIKDLVGEKFQALVDLRSVGLEGLKLTDAIAFSTGVQTTYTILLGNGLKMRATADHQHFTNQGWVATKDLTSDMKISIQRGEGSFGQGTITEKQAQMLGWLYGDGSIYKNKYGLDVVFYMNPKEYATVSPVLLEAVESVTGYQHKSSLVKGLYTFHSGSQSMRDFLEKLGVESKKCLPDTFLTQSKEVIVGFLQGLFSSDGHVCKHGSQIGLTNMYLDLLRQVQIILLNLGIKSHLAKKSPGKELVGIKYTLKDGTEKISQNRGSWVLTVSKGDGMRNFYKHIGFPFAPDKQKRLELAMSKPRRFYKEKIQEQWYTSKVVSVTEFGEEPVYDLTVPLTHSFIANGCITHNCGK